MPLVPFGARFCRAVSAQKLLLLLPSLMLSGVPFWAPVWRAPLSQIFCRPLRTRNSIDCLSVYVEDVYEMCKEYGIPHLLVRRDVSK